MSARSRVLWLYRESLRVTKKWPAVEERDSLLTNLRNAYKADKDWWQPKQIEELMSRGEICLNRAKKGIHPFVYDSNGKVKLNYP